MQESGHSHVLFIEIKNAWSFTYTHPIPFKQKVLRDI